MRIARPLRASGGGAGACQRGGTYQQAKGRSIMRRWRGYGVGRRAGGGGTRGSDQGVVGVRRLKRGLRMSGRRYVALGLLVALGLSSCADSADEPTAQPEPEEAAEDHCTAGGGATGESSEQSQPPADGGSGDELTLASSASHYGITWNFGSERPVGRFANGDWWVQGPVTITGITPEYDSTAKRNGWMINPSTTSAHGFDGEALDFKASLVPTLPHVACAGESIVKAISIPDGCNGKTCLQRAAVLTVVGEIPPDNGATSFRPPYYGKDKPLFSTEEMDANLSILPRLSSTTAVDEYLPSLATARDNVNKVQLGHIPNWTGDEIHPIENFGGLTDPYGPDLSNINVESFLRMLIVNPGDSEAERREVAIALTQYGIDIYAQRSAGVEWVATGGGDLGFKLPAAFAGLMLDDQAIRDTVANAPRNAFAESGQVLPANTTQPGVPLWGQPTGPEAEYWTDLTDEATRTIVDPYAIIDGGAIPGQWYQGCCTAQAMKGSALIVRLIPGLSEIWNDDANLEYADRWVDHGTWTQPDPCAPVSQGGGPNPARPGECILDPDLTPGSTFAHYSCQPGRECGRFPQLHGSSRDGGLHASALVDVAWSAYRDW
jgi:hypothetical protein